MSLVHSPSAHTHRATADSTAQWEAVADEVTALVATRLEPVVQKVRDHVYDTLLTTVQDYLCDNLAFNIASRLETAERGRRAEWVRAEELSSRVAELEATLRRARAAVIAFDVEDYVQGYEMRADEGAYAPTEDERFLLTDAIHGVLSEMSVEAAQTATEQVGTDGCAAAGSEPQ